ncbi:hypothetical protein LPJ66_004806 [Kickxella alabastrina]|uniref:Uncharacterized protein n=1 Tax=Kickxella alabastrina TaxID=61397 RepID=A0ACC1IFZ7_9FUNG|nr:hypothetical protein LPJ66_004806 [Kickxella alabastrina]
MATAVVTGVSSGGSGRVALNTAVAVTTTNPSAAFINTAAAAASQQLNGGHQLRHTSIFEIGGEPFGGENATNGLPSSRIGRIGEASNGGGTPHSSATPPIGMHPLGPIMGSPHSLFNGSAYGAAGQSQLPIAGPRGSRTPSVSQSRFNSVLGEAGLQTTGLGRNSDKDASGNAVANGATGVGHNFLDMGSGILDTMKSQQTSPNDGAQPKFNDFYIKSLPVSRRNSREFQNLWQELEGFSINDSSTHPSANLIAGRSNHLAGFDGHSIAARNSSGAFRSDPGNAAALGTSPKLPQGLLDDDMLTMRPKPAAVDSIGASTNGSGLIVRNPVSKLASISSSTDLASAGLYSDPRMDAIGGSVLGGLAQHKVANTDALVNESIGDSRLYDHGRAASLIRNASTPVLNTKQYQVLRSVGEMSHPAGQAHGGPAYTNSGGAPRYDMQAQLYSAHTQQGYPAGAGDPAYDLAANRHYSGAPNYPYANNAAAMGIGRTRSFVVNPSAPGQSGPMCDSYGMQGSYGPIPGPPIAGMYGMGHQPSHLGVPPAPLQHSHSHLHMHPPAQHQKQSQHQQKMQPQRHAQLQNQQTGHSAKSGPSVKQGNSGNTNAGSNDSHGRWSEAEASKFANVSLEELQGSIFGMCKDHQGCRFLQKTLEAGQKDQIDMIFKEASPHLSELMTNPFGNYLCQKLLEHCTEPQRKQAMTALAPDLVAISVNVHGTRAVQKIIDSVSSQAHINTIIGALRNNVVMLIRDINGNHVIQKCLSRLSSKHNQFIFDSVAESCIEVATHRHGCCVFQRCIDYATDNQKAQLVKVIVDKALTLVQDPFGNYVVQYVLDLGIMDYSEPLIRRFVDHICGLSVQKFSSNVMEKCIRIASPATRKMMVAPMLQREKLDMLMRDSYGNYVVQTALDFADQTTQRLEIIEAILPLLPHIRHTPYGKRIFIKLQRDGFVSAVPSAACSRHASPILGPSHASHSTAANASMPLHPQLASNSSMNGPMSATAAAADYALGHVTSPQNGNAVGAGGKSQVGHPRMYMTSAPGPGSNNGGAYQQTHHTHHQPGGGMYYYNMAGMDGAGQHQQQQQMYHGPVPMMPSGNSVYDFSAITSSGSAPLSAPSVSTGPAPVSGPPGAKLQTTSYYGAR